MKFIYTLERKYKKCQIKEEKEVKILEIVELKKDQAVKKTQIKHKDIVQQEVQVQKRKMKMQMEKQE